MELSINMVYLLYIFNQHRSDGHPKPAIMGHGNDSTYPCGLPDICPGGLILPILDERLWPKKLRVAIYLVLLLYFLLGISVVTDVFMTAIDKITSHTKKVYLAKESSEHGSEASLRPDQPEVIEVRIWNPTIANLTLMALGGYLYSIIII